MGWLLTVPAVYRWGATLGFAAMVVVLSITRGVERPGDGLLVWLVVHTPTTAQKILHIGVYALLAVLWMWALELAESRAVRAALAFAASAGLGAIPGCSPHCFFVAVFWVGDI